jgi:hypothetical protein
MIALELNALLTTNPSQMWRRNSELSFHTHIRCPPDCQRPPPSRIAFSTHQHSSLDWQSLRSCRNCLTRPTLAIHSKTVVTSMKVATVCAASVPIHPHKNPNPKLTSIPLVYIKLQLALSKTHLWYREFNHFSDHIFGRFTHNSPR